MNLPRRSRPAQAFDTTGRDVGAGQPNLAKRERLDGVHFVGGNKLEPAHIVYEATGSVIAPGLADLRRGFDAGITSISVR